MLMMVGKFEEYYLMSIKRYSAIAASISFCFSTATLQAAGFGITVQSASGGGTSATNHAAA